MKTIVLWMLLSILASAQQDGHAVTLTWVDDRNPAGTTYTVYRATGLCSGTPSWNRIAAAVAEKRYEDTTVQPGNYCYQVTATFNGMESAPSNTAHAPVPSFPPSALQITVR